MVYFAIEQRCACGEADQTGGQVLLDSQLLMNELRNFLDADGRLKSYPAKYKLKMLSLYYLASKLESGRRYTEKEINHVLCEWHIFEDWAMLRRDMYDNRFLDRKSDGSFYWLETEQPTFAALGLE